jgi:hypothetical protein
MKNSKLESYRSDGGLQLSYSNHLHPMLYEKDIFFLRLSFLTICGSHRWDPCKHRVSMSHELHGWVNQYLDLDGIGTNFRDPKMYLETSRTSGEFHSLFSFFFVDPYGCWPRFLQKQRFHEQFKAIKDHVGQEQLRVNENISNRDLQRLVMCFPLLWLLSRIISHIVRHHWYFPLFLIIFHLHKLNLV